MLLNASIRLKLSKDLGHGTKKINYFTHKILDLYFSLIKKLHMIPCDMIFNTLLGFDVEAFDFFQENLPIP
jgi:hypothetical protein